MHSKARRLAFKVTLIYVIVAAAWILFSDELVGRLIPDADARVKLSIYKGWVFVILTGGLLFQLLARLLKQWEREVTQRQQAEAAQLESEVRYHQLFAAATDAVAMVDCATGQILEVNPAMEKMYGFSRAELLGLTAMDVSAEPEKTQKAIATKEMQIPLRLHRRKDGTIFPVEISCSEFEFQKRRIHVAAMRDVSARQQADERLRDSEEKFSRMFDSSPVALTLTTLAEGRYLNVNDAFLKIFERTRAEVLGRTVFDLGIWVDLEQRKLLFAQLQEQGVVRNFEMELCTKSGRVIYLLWSGAQVVFGGEKCLLGSSLDITERKQTEVALKLSDFSVNQASLPTFWIASDARILRANRAACSQLGYTEAELCHQAVTELDPGFPAAEWPRHWQELRAAKHLRFETWHRHKAGHLIPVEVELNWFEFGGQEYNFAYARDVSERKRAEEKLLESQALYHSLVTQLPVGIFRKNELGRYVLVNPGFCQLKNVRATDFLDKTPTEVHDGEASAESVNGFSAKYATQGEEHHRLIMQTGQTIELDEECVRADGRKAFFHVIKFPVLNQDGKIIGSQGVLFDITERKKAEEQLRKLSRTVEQSPAAVVITNVHGKIEYVNQAFTRMTGYVLEEVLGKTPRVLKSGRTPPEVYQDLWSTITAGKIWVHELLNRHKNGGLFWEQTAISPLLDHRGKVTHYIAIKEDISERRQKAEELRWQTAQLEAQLEAALDGILVVDQAGRKVLQNQQLIRLFKVPVEMAVDEDDSKLLRHVVSQTRNPAQFVERVNHLYAHRDEIGHDEIELADGRVLDRYSAPVRDKLGAYLGRIWTFRDISKSRIMEAQLRQAQKMEAIGTLAGGIAHDFNNILAAMFGYGYLLQQDTAGNAAAQEDLAEILKAATRAKDLVQQILTFSRQREQKRQIIPLDIVVKEAMKFLRASLPAEIQIEVKLALDAPTVLADATQIYQVTMNLATNALHAMEGQPGRLDVSLEPFTPTEAFIHTHPEFRGVHYARLTLADTGHGMDAKTLERVFEPFFTTKPVGKGTGLGLSVVHGIVQSHEGIITIESEVGKGTTFSLYFPAQISQAAQPEILNGQTVNGHGQRILLLDDEPALTAPFQRLLERLKYHVTICNHAPDAVTMFRENPALFDLVITDLTMPEMNGLEVARQLRAIRATVPVILVSGLAPDLNREKLHAAGVCELLEKPVSMATLGEALKNAFKKV